MIENNPFLITAINLVLLPSPPVININPFLEKKDRGITDWSHFWEL